MASEHRVYGTLGRLMEGFSSTLESSEWLAGHSTLSVRLASGTWLVGITTDGLDLDIVGLEELSEVFFASLCLFLVILAISA